MKVSAMKKRIPTPETSDSEELSFTFEELRDEGIKDEWIAYILQEEDGQESRYVKYHEKVNGKDKRQKKKRETLRQKYGSLAKKSENHEQEDSNSLSFDEKVQHDKFVKNLRNQSTPKPVPDLVRGKHDIQKSRKLRDRVCLFYTLLS